MRALSLAAFVFATVATPALCQPLGMESLKSHATVPLAGKAVEVGENCAGGLIYDDGAFENGFRFTNNDSRFAQRVDLVGPAKLSTVCVCWQALGTDTSVSFNLQVYDANGPNGAPGALLASVPATASVPSNGFTGRFFRYDLSGQNINLSGNAYVGAQWNGNLEPGIFLCADEGPAPPQPAYGSINGGANWVHMILLAPLFEAFGLRAEIGDSQAGCVPSATAMCLAGNRYKVEATFDTGSQQGQAKVVRLTPDTGYLWFFSDTNVEAVVKVLDACGLNQKFWVFAGGLTNVNTVITITDTQTGAVKTYTNPQGTAFKPIQDTSAFSCN